MRDTRTYNNQILYYRVEQERLETTYLSIKYHLVEQLSLERQTLLTPFQWVAWLELTKTSRRITPFAT
jgi:hypothetical protein